MHDTIEKVLQLSQADSCIVIGYDGTNANLRFANNSLTTNGLSNTRELFVISIVGRKVGVVGASYFPDERLEELVRSSEAAAVQQTEAEDYAELLGGDEVPVGWNEPSAATDFDSLSGLTEGLGEAFKSAEKDNVKLFGYAQFQVTSLFVATSAGRRRRFDQRLGQFEFNAKSPDFSRSAWTGESALDLNQVDVNQHYRHLKQRLEWSQTRLDLPAGKYEVILEPSAVADMLIYAYWTATARDADQGRTVFSKPGGGSRVGQRLFSKDVSIYSDPHEPGVETTPFEVAAGSASWSSIFDNGIDLKRTDWVKQGVLQHLITPRWWAERQKTEPTPIIENLVMEGKGPDLEAMIKATKRGLLVTCLWYIREVDPQRLLLTGLTRDGVYLIEDGVVKGAVNNFRFNMSPIEMLGLVKEIGRSTPALAREFGDYFTLTRVPPLRVKDFNMSSVSQAT